MLATSTRPSPQARLQLTDLPDEMVLHIMRWLPLRDLAHCRQLSSRFNAIASDASLWRALCHVLYGCSRGDSKALTSKNHHNHHHNHNNHSHASKHWIDHVRTLRECAARYGGRLDHVDLAGNTVLHLEIAHKRVCLARAPSSTCASWHLLLHRTYVLTRASAWFSVGGWVLFV